MPSSILPRPLCNLLAFGLFLGCLAQPLISQVSQDWPVSGEGLEPDPAITFGQLENGFRYALMPHGEPPGRVSVRMVFQVGSLMEAEGEEGIAHYLEHMAFKGTRRFPEGEMIAYLQGLGMAFGPDTNASTGFDRTTYQLDLPDNTPERLREGLELMRDYGDGILFSPEEIDRERGVILAEKQARDSVRYRAFVAWLNFMLPDTLYSERLPIGLRDSIKAFQRDDFLGFYHTWYQPDRMILVVVGDFEPAKWVSTIEEIFGDLDPAPSPSNPNTGSVELPTFRAGFHRDAESPATSVEIISIREQVDSADTAERRRQQLAESLTNRILTRRLDRISEKEDAAFVSGRVGAFDWYDDFRFSTLTLQSESDEWETMIQAGAIELRRALQFGFTVAEVREASANLLSEAREAVERAEGRSSRAIANELAETLNRDRVFISPQSHLDLVEGLLGAITPEDLHGTFREQWDDLPISIFVSGDFPETESPEERAEESWFKGQEAAVTAPGEAEVKEFPYQRFGPRGTVDKVTRDEELEFFTYHFSNGVILHAKSTDFEPGVIQVSVRFGRGRIALPESPEGLIPFAEGLYVEGGLGQVSFDQLQTLMAGKTVSVDFGVGDDGLLLSGSTRPEDFETQMRLLAAYLLDPGYRPEAERRFRRSLNALYRSLQTTWQGVLRSEVRPFLRSDDHRFRFPSREALESISVDQLRAWLDPQRRALPVEITVVGDIQPARAATVVSETFAAIGFRDAGLEIPPLLRDVAFPSKSGLREFSFESEIDQAVVLASWPGFPQEPIQRSREMNLLADALENRLRTRIRDEMGVSYTLNVWNQPSRVFAYGQFNVLVVTDHESMPAVEIAIQEVVAEALKEGIGEEEFIRARAPALSQIDLMLRNNGYWAGVLGGSSQRPEQVEWARTIKEGFESILPGDLSRRLRNDLDPDQVVFVRIFNRIAHPEALPPPDSAVESPGSVSDPEPLRVD